MVNGFLSNVATVAGVTTAYDLTQKVRLLGAPMNSAKPPSPTVTVVDVKARSCPQSGYFGDLVIGVIVTAGTPTALTAVLYWDAACDHKAYGPGTLTLDPGLTTTTIRTGVVAIDEIYRAPTTQTTKGELYLVVKTDSGTCTIARVRLDWADQK